eukprot:2825016-Rhodomonas_salina.1
MARSFTHSLSLSLCHIQYTPSRSSCAMSGTDLVSGPRPGVDHTATEGIAIDSKSKTNVPNIFAAGDCCSNGGNK